MAAGGVRITAAETVPSVFAYVPSPFVVKLEIYLRFLEVDAEVGVFPGVFAWPVYSPVFRVCLVSFGKPLVQFPTVQLGYHIRAFAEYGYVLPRMLLYGIQLLLHRLVVCTGRPGVPQRRLDGIIRFAVVTRDKV